MKEIMAIVRINMMNKTKQALAEAGISSVTARDALGRGKGLVDLTLLEGAEKGYEEAIAQLGQSQRLIPKRIFFVVVPDRLVPKTVQTIIDREPHRQIRATARSSSCPFRTPSGCAPAKPAIRSWMKSEQSDLELQVLRRRLKPSDTTSNLYGESNMAHVKEDLRPDDPGAQCGGSEAGAAQQISHQGRPQAGQADRRQRSGRRTAACRRFSPTSGPSPASSPSGAAPTPAARAWCWAPPGTSSTSPTAPSAAASIPG